MRIVAVADTHTFQDDLDMPDGDVFVHAGDLLRGGTLEELAPVAEWIESLPYAHKIVVAGNHEWCFMDERPEACGLLGPEVVYLEDSEVEIDGVRFWGSPWQPAFRNWAFNLPRGRALAQKWAQIPSNVHVLITHGPPMGIGDQGSMSGRHGCQALLDRVAQVAPRLHMFGHIHQDGGAWLKDQTVFANVTTWECERAPTVIDLDPKTHEISLVQVPPRTTPQ